MHKLLGLAGLALLPACTNLQSVDLNAAAKQLEWANLQDETRRDFDAAYRDLPFDRGVVYAVADEHGELHTYSLRPCGGSHICGGSGRVGHVQRTLDYFVVTEAYPGRTFYLSPGGDGYLKWRGEDRDLAWN